MKNKRFRRGMTAAIAAAACLCLTVGAVAASRHGFFRDKKDWSGAVVGVQYEQATDDVQLSVAAEENRLVARAKLNRPDDVPYSELETLAIDRYQIVDASGKTVASGGRTAFFEIVDGEARVEIPTSGLSRGAYTLVVTSFVGGKKADQPLPISGEWAEPFTV